MLVDGTTVLTGSDDFLMDSSKCKTYDPVNDVVVDQCSDAKGICKSVIGKISKINSIIKQDFKC